MIEYDKVGEIWIPYLMKCDTPSISFNSVNTDEWGLRKTVDSNGLLVDIKKLDSYKQKIGVVLGPSVAFGVGASDDSKTVPSILTRSTDTQWLNFGGRAYNSTQEMLKLVLHMPKRVNSIIVFSGVNNLTLAHLSPYTSAVFNSFYSQSSFEQAVKHRFFEDYIGIKAAAKRLYKEFQRKLSTSKQNIIRKTLEESYENILICFERDLTVLKLLANGCSADLYFVLQPLATWLNKKFTKEEQEIFAELDSSSDDFKVLAKYFQKNKESYFRDVEFICNKHAIKYLNLNTCTEFESDEWIFVDRVHLTDKGNQIVCDAIKRKFSI
jgi:hypothetical protein